MSNRKYAAAVLEGGPASDNDRMKAITDILAVRINDVVKDILDGSWVPTSNEEPVFRKHIQEWFEEMSPELAKEYEIQVGTVENVTAPGYRIIVGHRPKPKRMSWWEEGIRSARINVDASHITAGSINATTIQAGAITADRINPHIMTGTLNVGNVDGYIRANDTQRLDGLRDIQSIRINERYGMGVINTGGTATVGNINFAPIWHQGNDGAGTGLDVDMVDGIHTREWATAQLEPFDVQIGDTIYRNVEVTGVIEDV
jgi:hypothetical protein